MEPRLNAGYDWDLFDSESYFQHYYGEPHVDDENVVRLACGAIARAEPAGLDLDMIDIGTGPSLIPLLAGLPRARSLTAWEYSTANVAWLEAELSRRPLRPQWEHFWDVVKRSYPDDATMPADAPERLRATARVRQGSVYDLPEAGWDLATMFFCAESITGNETEFRLACTRFAGCVRPGGTLVAAFLIGSSDYQVAGRPFPILDVSKEQVLSAFEPMTTQIEAVEIGIVDREIRSGYAGMLYLTAVRGSRSQARD